MGGRRLLIKPLDHRPDAEAEMRWMSGFGEHFLWTEYTLYRSVLDDVRVFHEVHLPEELAGLYLHCSNVWYTHQLPWKAEEAYRNSTCLFSVVQSSTGATPSSILRQIRS